MIGAFLLYSLTACGAVVVNSVDCFAFWFWEDSWEGCGDWSFVVSRFLLCLFSIIQNAQIPL